jgi:hypothetical protein
MEELERLELLLGTLGRTLLLELLFVERLPTL